MNRKIWLLGWVAAGACAMAPFAALAQNAARSGSSPGADTGAGTSSALQEIVVTAQRRSESLQQVPIAVSAVTASQLAARGIGDSLSLAASVPNLDITQNGTTLTLYMRGVGSNASDPNDESSVAFYVDGVYQASPLVNLFDFNNIDRVEVLKGPQGTLFGRNATGGVIQVITKDPQETFSGQGSVSYGNYDTVGANAYVTGGIAKNLAADLAVVYRQNFDGYGENIFLHVPIMRREDLGFRSKLLWTPEPDTTVGITVDYSLVRSDGTPYQLAPGVIGADGVTSYPGAYKTNTNEEDAGNSDSYGVSAKVEHDFHFARLVSISAVRDVFGMYDLDEDATPAPVVNSFIHQLARNYSQELQLLSPSADSRLQWVLGGYYFYADYAYDPITIGGLAAGGPTAAENIFGRQYTSSVSLYGQATYEVLPGTHVTGGLRYTDEQQGIHSYVTVGGTTVLTVPNQRQNTEKPTWRLAIDHQFTPDILAYFSYNRGIKSGGYNMLSPGAPGYHPEVLDAYEVGLKTEFLDHRARVNLATFYYDYQDIQVQNIEAGAVNTVNAAAATIYGFDGDFMFIPIPNLTLSSSVGYTHGTYSNFQNATFTPPSPLDGPQFPGNASGNRLINTPQWTAGGSIEYRFLTDVGSFTPNVSDDYKDKVIVSDDNRLDIPSHTVANASLTWRMSDQKYWVQLWTRNMFDARYYASRVETSVGDLQYLAAPRTFGVTIGSKF